MNRALWTFLVLIGQVSLAGGLESLRLDFPFSESNHGFAAQFADLPEDHEERSGFNLVSDWRPLPDEVRSGMALYISGHNLSDDLWMHWQKEIRGLKPDTYYLMTIEVEFLSKYGTGTIGIGGSPGDSVHFKAGSSPVEPKVAPNQNGDLRLNLDKGNQAEGGADLPVLGTVATPFEGSFEYAFVSRDNHGNPLRVKTSPEGTLWLVFGTDSGFEGQTELYYTRAQVWMNTVDTQKLWIESDGPDTLKLVWNRGEAQTSTNLVEWSTIDAGDRPIETSLEVGTPQFWRLQATD